MNKDEPKNLVLICLDNISNSTGFFELGNFLHYLHDKGIKVTYISLQMSSDEKIIENPKANYKIIRVPLKMKPVELIENTVTIFQQQVEKADIIHSMNWVSGACGQEICKNYKYKARHIYSFDILGRVNIKDKTNMTSKEIFIDNWELKIFESVEWLIAPYSFLAESFIKSYPKIFHQRLIVVPYGVDHKLFRPIPWQQNEPGCIDGL
jgi:hypothetical protein